MTPPERGRRSLRRGVTVAATAAAGFLAVWTAAGGSAERSGSDGDDGLPRLPPPRGELVPFTRVAVGRLEIPMPGVLAVRDSAEWHTLLARYLLPHPRPDSLPVVDFSRETLLLVGYGGAFDCTDPGRYVQRVERRGDTLQATLAWGHFPDPPPELICAAVPPSLVDAVRVPHAGLPVRFIGWTPEFPVPADAPWLQSPGVAQTDTLSAFLRPLFRRFLAADSATPRNELAHLAAVLREEPHGDVAAAMLENPRVRADLPLLRELLATGGGDHRGAMEVLLAHHGNRLAGDADTDSATLRLLIAAVRATGDSSGVPLALARHRRILGDSGLAHALYQAVERRQVPCADLQRLWWAKRWYPGDVPICTPWDDSPFPPGLKRPAPPPAAVPWHDTLEVIHAPGGRPPRFRPRPPPAVAEGPAAR